MDSHDFTLVYLYIAKLILSLNSHLNMDIMHTFDSYNLTSFMTTRKTECKARKYSYGCKNGKGYIGHAEHCLFQHTYVVHIGAKNIYLVRIQC